MKKYKTIFLVIVSSIFLASFLSISITAINLITRNGKKTTRSRTFQYRYSHFDISLNVSKIGIIETPQEIQAGKSVYKKSGEENILISSFGTTEYSCTGNCFCQENERRTSEVLTRSVVFLVATISSVLAWNKAREYFNEECEKKLSNICDESSIHSEVDVCEEIISGSTVLSETTTTTTEEESSVESSISESSKEEEVEKDIRRFMCKGKCIKNDNIKPKYKEAVFAAEHFKCERFKGEGEVEVDCSIPPLRPSCYMRAANQFVRQYMRPLCRKSSSIEYHIALEMKDLGPPPRPKKRTYRHQLCIAKSHRNNPVKCIQTYPTKSMGKRVRRRIKKEYKERMLKEKGKF